MKSLINTTSLVTVPRERASYFLSRERVEGEDALGDEVGQLFGL
ncbi:MAG TPA: hypothetical protein VKB86_09180 [Pyrinomonadaceae bacterium]|nr:hypothetical protein [Pyrinomonadaceae bacterium]